MPLGRLCSVKSQAGLKDRSTHKVLNPTLSCNSLSQARKPNVVVTPFFAGGQTSYSSGEDVRRTPYRPPVAATSVELAHADEVPTSREGPNKKTQDQTNTDTNSIS